MLAERVTQWAEKWKDEGWKEGQKEGRSALLERLLQKRFGGGYTAYFQNRVREANPEQLNLWAERILEAEDIDDVFKEME